MAKQTTYPAIGYDLHQYPIAQVAQHLCCSVRTLERYEKDRLLVITRISRKNRVVQTEHLLRFELSRDGADVGALIARMSNRQSAIDLLSRLAREVNASFTAPVALDFPAPKTPVTGAPAAG